MGVVCSILLSINVLGLAFDDMRTVRGFVVSQSPRNYAVDFSFYLEDMKDLYGEPASYKRFVVSKDQCVLENE